jgi:hypothetical protein
MTLSGRFIEGIDWVKSIKQEHMIFNYCIFIATS